MISLFKLKAILSMGAVFALGAIIGASSGGILVSRNATSAHLPAHKSKPAVVEKFKARLKLSAEQTRQMEILLDETQYEFRQLHLAVKPQFEEIRQEMRSAIRQVLNDEQKREYEAMIRERDRRKKNQEGQDPIKPPV